MLESALRLRPNDGELLLFAADVYARWGKDGNELLVRAQQRAPKAAWLRTAAHLADFRGDRAETLRLWREVLASEPLALDAHRAVAQAIAESEGTTAAIGHLKEVCSRFPTILRSINFGSIGSVPKAQRPSNLLFATS